MTKQINLFILSTRQRMTLELKGRTVLGRSAGVEDDGTLNIDLSPFMAYQLGVSRRHLMLIPEDDKVLAFDLSSRNGSFLNDEAMSSRKGYELSDEDELRLGTLSIRVYITREVPYLDMQTRQLPDLDNTPQPVKPAPEQKGITAPLPDIRATLNSPAPAVETEDDEMEKASNGS